MKRPTIVRQLPVDTTFENEFGTWKVLRHGRSLGTLIRSTATRHNKITTPTGVVEFESPAGDMWVSDDTPVDKIIAP